MLGYARICEMQPRCVRRERYAPACRGASRVLRAGSPAEACAWEISRLRVERLRLASLRRPRTERGDQMPPRREANRADGAGACAACGGGGGLEVVERVVEREAREQTVLEDYRADVALREPLDDGQSFEGGEELVIAAGADDNGAEAEGGVGRRGGNATPRALQHRRHQHARAIWSVEELVVRERRHARPRRAVGADGPSALGAREDRLARLRPPPTSAHLAVAVHAPVLRRPEEPVAAPALAHGAALGVEEDPLRKLAPVFGRHDGRAPTLLRAAAKQRDALPVHHAHGRSPHDPTDRRCRLLARDAIRQRGNFHFRRRIVEVTAGVTAARPRAAAVCAHTRSTADRAGGRS